MPTDKNKENTFFKTTLMHTKYICWRTRGFDDAIRFPYTYNLNAILR